MRNTAETPLHVLHPVAPVRQELADRLHVSIRPTRKWTALNLRDIWSARELLYFLCWRDVKIRYKQTLLGVTWAILQPLLTMLIFTLFFGTLARMPSDDIPYPLFSFAALLPWTFFSNALSASGNSLVGSAHLITKVYFPRVLIPMAAVGAALVDFAIGFVLLGGLMAFYRWKGWYTAPVSWNIVCLPIPVILTSLLALAVGMWTSALNVRYRDVRYALPFLIQIWMFATPIIYPASLIPQHWRWVLALNPLTGIIEGYRAVLFGLPLDGLLLGTSALITLLLLLVAVYHFRQMEKSFADII